MNNYTDDKFSHIESDIEKIQVKPNMYISYIGSAGSLHLIKEAINNDIDECINPNSPCNNISVYLNLKENYITITDNGRGIPFDFLETSCTKLQSGSKFSRATSLGSAGENGVGLTAINALSEEFTITSDRDKESYTLRFKNGKLVNKEKSKTKHRGLTVSFKPSKKFLGKCDFILEDVEEWLNDIQYMLPKDLKLEMTIEKKGKEAIIKRVYKNKNGMVDVLDTMVGEEKLLSPIALFDMTHITEEVLEYYDNNMTNVSKERFLGIEVAFTYSSDIHNTELTMRSFCNFVTTVDHGVHADAVRNAIQTFLSKETKKIVTEKEAKKLDITFNDVSQGLNIALYLSTDHQVHFASQTKEKVSNKLLYTPIKEMVSIQLKEYFDRNPSDLKKITTFIKANAKMRLAAISAKKSVLKDEFRGNFMDYADNNFYPANNKGKKDYRELFIVEGDSAGGGAKKARYDADTQAIFCAKGKVKNSYDCTISKVLENDELKSLTTKLGCNIGDKFNINNLYYDKIIIMTDADVDGRHIRSGYVLFFYRHLPEIVKAGKLYTVTTPLYKVRSGKKEVFLSDKEELIKTFHDNSKDKVELITLAGKPLSKKEYFEFLLINTEYDEELTATARFKGVSYKLIETVAMYWQDQYKDIKNLEKALKKRFDEISIEDNVISGNIDGQRQVLNLNNRLYSDLDTLRRFIKLNKSPLYKTKIEGQKKGELHISEIMVELSRYKPDILDRYKGLGELSTDELRDLVMNPNNRRLIRLDIHDKEKTDEVFEVLFGNSSKPKIDKKRKEMMSNYVIPKHYLDS